MPLDRRASRDWLVAHRINAERIVLAGWSRAILLQMAHPLIAAGVVDHSSFRDNPVASVRRLHQTVRAMLSLTFGDEAAHEQTIATIRAIHRRVHGTLRQDVGRFPAGTTYTAEDPALLRWVHATLIESSVLVYDALVDPVSLADRDAYCRASAGVAIALGAQPDEVPGDWGALMRYIEDVHRSGTLAVGRDAQTIAAALLRGGVSTLAGPVAWTNRLVTAGWLPSAVRSQYGLSWNDARERRFQRSLTWLHRARKMFPRAVAWWREARR